MGGIFTVKFHSALRLLRITFMINRERNALFAKNFEKTEGLFPISEPKKTLADLIIGRRLFATSENNHKSGQMFSPVCFLFRLI